MLILRAMTMPNWQARRATIDDLQKLFPIWQKEGLPAEELGKRLQEFQVAEAGGEILGALAMQVVGLDARLHSEAFADAAQADAVREKLWERVQMVAKNHGLVRLWTQLGTPFWHQGGFQNPPPEVMQKLPPVFAGAAQPWHYLQLKEETGPPLSIEKEFALFKEMEQENTQKIHRQAKVLKLVAAVVVMVVFGLVVALILVWMRAKGVQPK